MMQIDINSLLAGNLDYQKKNGELIKSLTKQSPAMIQKELLGIRRTILENKKLLESKSGSERQVLVTQLNVDSQIKVILENHEIKGMVEEGKLTVLGMLFDLTNAYGRGYGAVILTNLNGITEINKIEKELEKSIKPEFRSRIKRI